MNKTNNQDKKQVLIESSEFVSAIRVSNELKEALSMSSSKKGTLIVKNIPCTILNRENQNGRVYSTAVMAEALVNAKEMLASKQMLSQACEHPEGSFVSPTDASHVVIAAYIKKNVRITVEGAEEVQDVLFMDWEILNTQEGKNLRALFEAECSVGLSIRGLGDMVGKDVANYELLGCDCVGNPSSSTFARMPVKESIEVTLMDERELLETYNVSTSSTNVTRDLETAARLQAQLDNLKYGTVAKTSTKVDEEINAKTGAEVSITTLEVETSDDVTDIDQALALARGAFTNGTIHVDSITIENIEEKNESVKEDEGDEDMGGDDMPADGLEAGGDDMGGEEISEAKDGEVFVIASGKGYVMIGDNILQFTKNKNKALQFKAGEDHGLFSIDNIKKTLLALGVYDAKKEPLNVVEECDTPAKEKVCDDQEMPIKEDGEHNTKYVAVVSLKLNNGGQSEETVPVSSVSLDSAVNEIGNLWEMKRKSDDVTRAEVQLVDTTTGERFSFNPTDQSLTPTTPTLAQEAKEGEFEQDDKTLTMQISDDEVVEKEFETPEQAAVVKAGIENGELDGEEMLKDAIEDEEASEEEPSETVEKPEGDFYVKVGQHGVFGETFDVMCDIAEFLTTDEVEDSSVAEVGLMLNDEPLPLAKYTISTGWELLVTDANIDEKLLNQPDVASDEYVDTPLEDAVYTDFEITLGDIDWDVDSVIDNMDFDADDAETYIQLLPDETTIRVATIDIPDDASDEEIKKIILDAASEHLGIKINNAKVLCIVGAEEKQIDEVALEESK